MTRGFEQRKVILQGKEVRSAYRSSQFVNLLSILFISLSGTKLKIGQKNYEDHMMQLMLNGLSFHA